MGASRSAVVGLMKLTLDYETYSRCDLTRTGMSKYGRDPSTDMICAASAKQMTTEREAVRQWIAQAEVIHAHNAGFEKIITREVLGVDVPTSKWRDTAARARHANLPGDLDGACRALNIPAELRKDSKAQAEVRKLWSPHPRAGKTKIVQKAAKRLGRPEIRVVIPEHWDRTEYAALYEKLFAYCRQDVIAEKALEQRLPPLPAQEQAYWEMDNAINERGFPVDLEFCRGAAKILTEAFDEVSTSVRRLGTEEDRKFEKDRAAIVVALAEVKDHRIERGTQDQRIKKYVNMRGLNIDNMQADTVNDALELDGLPPDVRYVLQLRQSVSGSAVDKYFAAIDAACEDDRLRDGTIFYGASATGRVTGNGFNPLNMKKKKLDQVMIEAASTGDYGLFSTMYEGYPGDLLGGQIRGIICAPPGRTLVDADSAQIELRIVHWLAGDDVMLDAMRAGFDPYVVGYAKMYGVTPASVTKDQRQQGKILGLGMQYAMGPTRLRAAFAKDKKLISLDEAKKIIYKYRDDNPEVAALWDKLTSAAILAIKRDTAARCGRLVFEMQGDWLTMKLPSGRRLYYYKPSVAQNQYGFPCVMFDSPYKGRRSIGGGHILENAAQAICRDLMYDWMLEMHGLGMWLLFNVYDQCLIECAQDEANDVKGEVERIMSRNPDWSAGLPLGVEAVIKRRFEK